MKFVSILTTGLLAILGPQALAQSYQGVVGYRQVPGVLTIQGEYVSVRAQDTSCVMKFGPVIGTRNVVDGFDEFTLRVLS